MYHIFFYSPIQYSQKQARRQHAGGLFSAAVDGTRSSTTRNTKTSANIGGGGTTTGGGDDTWGDFLMHVALLSSSSSSGGPTHQHNKAIHRRPNSGMKRGIIATTTKEGHREVGTRSFLPPFGAEEVQQQPKQRMGGASVGGSADSGSLPPAPVSRSVNHHLDSGVLVEAGKADGGPGALEDGRQSAKGEVGSGRTGLRRRRSQSGEEEFYEYCFFAGARGVGKRRGGEGRCLRKVGGQGEC